MVEMWGVFQGINLAVTSVAQSVVSTVEMKASAMVVEKVEMLV